tara:strand:+ start:3050 stop:3889 length:840 start_codon:yes stop_codon:yes gene_type:complete
MEIFKSKSDLINTLKKLEGPLGLVPTMGGIHEGHLSLIQKASRENASVIVSIFVNPIQFDNIDDLKNYPRNLKKDALVISEISDDIKIYAPTQKDVYGGKFKKNKYDFDKLDKVMEGIKRKNHFNGVANIIEFLFKTFNPQNAYFGEKDYQQLQIIRNLNKRLGDSTNVIQCPTIRNKNGLALSSRNTNLTDKEQKIASKIYECLLNVKKMAKVNSYEEIVAQVSFKFLKIKECNLDYFMIANPNTLIEISSQDSIYRNRAFIAVKFGETRLIDNIALS